MILVKPTTQTSTQTPPNDVRQDDLKIDLSDVTHAVRDIKSERDAEKLRRRMERKSRANEGPHVRSYAVTSQNWLDSGRGEGWRSSLNVGRENGGILDTPESEDTAGNSPIDLFTTDENIKIMKMTDTSPGLEPSNKIDENLDENSEISTQQKSHRLILKDRRAIARQRQGKIVRKKPASVKEKRESLRAFDFSRESTLRRTDTAATGAAGDDVMSPKKRSSQSRRLSQQQQQQQQRHKQQKQQPLKRGQDTSQGLDREVNIHV